jgi:hypothetical protein
MLNMGTESINFSPVLLGNLRDGETYLVKLDGREDNVFMTGKYDNKNNMFSHLFMGDEKRPHEFYFRGAAFTLPMRFGN